MLQAFLRAGLTVNRLPRVLFLRSFTVADLDDWKNQSVNISCDPVKAMAFIKDLDPLTIWAFGTLCLERCTCVCHAVLNFKCSMGPSV